MGRVPRPAREAPHKGLASRINVCAHGRTRAMHTRNRSCCAALLHVLPKCKAEQKESPVHDHNSALLIVHKYSRDQMQSNNQ